jgi:hypothetical protein
MLVTVLFLLLLAMGLGGGVLGWIQWSSGTSRSQSPKWRGILGLLSLIAVSFQVLIFVLFEAYALVAKDFGYRSRNFFLWGRIDFYLCAVALFAAVLGKGRYRVPAALSAVALEVIWFLLGMGL